MSAPQSTFDSEPRPETETSQSIRPDDQANHKETTVPEEDSSTLRGIALGAEIFSGITASAEKTIVASEIFSELSLPSQADASEARAFPNVSLPFHSAVTAGSIFSGMDPPSSSHFPANPLMIPSSAPMVELFPGSSMAHMSSDGSFFFHDHSLSDQGNMFMEKSSSLLDFRSVETVDSAVVRIPDQSLNRDPSMPEPLTTTTPALGGENSFSGDSAQEKDTPTEDHQPTQADLPHADVKAEAVPAAEDTVKADESQAGSHPSSQADQMSKSDNASTEPKERKRTKRKRVSDELRELIHAHAMDNLSNKEIAMALRLPRQTVYSILNPKAPPPSDDNCPRADKRFNKDRDAIQKRIIFYVNINPDMKTRDIQRLLGAEGYFISEKSVASWRQGTVLAIQILGINKSNQLLAHEAASLFLQTFIREDDGTLDSGVVYVSHHCIKISIRDFGQMDSSHKKPAQEGKVGTLGAFFSIFLAVTGEGILFSDCVRFIAPTPSIEESIQRFFQSPAVAGRKIVLSSCFDAQKFFYEMAGPRGHSVVSMPENMTFGHLGEVVFYNLPRYIRSLNPQTREKVSDILSTDATLFPRAEVQALYRKSRAVTFGAILGPGHRLPPAKGIIPTPITPPTKDDYQHMSDSFKNGEPMACMPNLSQILQEYTDMLF